MIYLDNAASTPLLPEVKEFYFNAMEDLYANPHAGHALSRKCSLAADKAKSQILKAAKAKPQNYSVIFTSGGTEANNIAILGQDLKAGDEVWLSEAEHPSVLNPAKELQRRGISIKNITLSPCGAPDFSSITVNHNTKMIIVTLLHNETGALTDLTELQLDLNKVYVHVDAVQGFGKCPLNMDQWQIHSLSLAGHKFHGPNSSGALIYKNSFTPAPLMWGGGQQDSLRPGTLDAAAASALGFTAEFNARHKKAMSEKIEQLNLYCREKLLQLKNRKNQDIKVKLISSEKASPYILLASFPEMQGAIIMRALSAANVIVGTGSACSADAKDISPALKSLGIDKKTGFGVIRISFAWQNTLEEIDTFIAVLQDFIKNY